MNNKTWYLFTFFRIIATMVFAGIGCAHSQVTLFQQNSNVKITTSSTVKPTESDEVGIYRSTTPFDSFVEIGLITFTTNYFDLPEIYNRLRMDSAPHGAQAIVGLKTKGETHSEWVTKRKCEQKTDCDMNGQCSSREECHDEQVLETVTSFMTEGSMIRRKP